MIPVNHSPGPANPNIYEVDPEQSEASREWNTYLAHHADYIRRNLVIGKKGAIRSIVKRSVASFCFFSGERYLLSEGELLEYFRNALGDGNCFFHSVIASCLSERTLGDDRELGRAVHSWSAIEMGRLVECGILDREFLADYLEFSGGTIEDAVRIAQTDQARPTIQFTLSHLIGRPIAYISRQSADRAENPRVGLYVPTDPSSALREPVFVAHEYYGVSSSADGGSGHYMVLRRRRQAQHLVPRSDSRSASLHCEGDKREMEPTSVGRNSDLVTSPVLTPQKSHRESASTRKLSSRKRCYPEKDKCQSCGTFLGRDGTCSKCSKRVVRSPHAIGMVHEISGAMQCVQKNKTASSRSCEAHDIPECAQKCKTSSCRKITIDNVQERVQNRKILSPRCNTAGNISKCAQNRKSPKSREVTPENAQERVQNNETSQAEVGENFSAFGNVHDLQASRSHVNSNRDGQKLDSSSVVIEMTDVFFNQVQFYFHVRNHLFREESVSHCHNCLRWSTTGYPFRLKIIAAKDVICRKYVLLTRKSNRYSGKREYTVCEACFSYITDKRRGSNVWAVAWPTFIAYNLVKAGFLEIWSWIPLELRVAWLPSVPLFHSSLSHVTLRDPPPFFEDYTERRLHLLEVIDRMRGAELRHALNENCVAQVRCYCGAQEFLEDAHLLSLQFALVRQYSQMSELGVLLPRSQANKDFMAASRSDWLHSWMFLGKWRVGPSVVVDSVKGLCLLVCSEHKKGGLLKHVNLAYNPIQLNKPCSYPDRLGGLVVAPQIIKPLVKKYNVNTYEVLRLTGSYNGMSSSMLHTRRRWDITSSQLAESERLQVICRRDVRERLKHMLLSGEISDEIFSSLLENTHLSAAEENSLNYCKKSATLFDLDNLLDCRKALYGGHCNRRNVVSCFIEDAEGEKRVSYNLPWPFRLLKSSFNSCVQPLEIVPKKIKKKGTDLRYTWLLCTLLVNVAYLWSLVCEFVSLCERETWEGHLLKFMSIKILKLNILAIGKENPYAKIKDPCGLEATIKSALEGHGEVEENIASYLANLRTVSRYEISSHQLGDLQHHVEPSKSCQILILTRIDKSRLNANEIPLIFDFDKRKYILRYVGFARSAIASDNTRTFHAESCTTPLLSSAEFIHYSSATTYPNTVSCIPSQLTQHWTLLCYEISNKANLRQHRVDYMQSIDSTAVLFCTHHRLPLARDSVDTIFTCCIDAHFSINNCKRKSYVRCLSKSCSVCLCREHYQNFLNPNVPLPSELSRNLPSSESSSVPFSAEELHDQSCSSELSFLESESFWALSCTGTNSGDDSSEYMSSADSVTTHSDSSILESGVSIESFFADSCDIPLIENTDSSQVLSCFVDEEDEKTSIPRHIIFNVDSQLLKRNSRRITGTLAQRRYLHSIVSNDPGKSLPLINFEGDVFPSIFYNQADDGLFSGSIPQFLYNSEAENRYFGFAGVDAMLRSRIKDGASLTGTDPRYIAHAFDAIVNLELRASDTRLVQSRGYEHLLGYHTHHPAESRMSFDSVDSRRRICELASFTKSSPEYFYTHTVSMRHHPGVSPIFVEAERQGYTDSDSDLTRMRDISIAVQLIRSSERAVRFIWQYILRSPEKPLGEVISVWYRSEWQSDGNHAGNLPHTHGLIKIKPETQSVDECLQRIICSTSRLFNNKDYLMEIGLIESESDYNELVARASRVQQHDCHAANYRCHRFDEKTGVTKCRTPHYPPTEEYSFRDYTPTHSETALDLLVRMGLAHRDAAGDLIWNDKLIGGKYFYPADSAEHFVPTSNHLWALHRSQCNLLYCDQYRRSRYIAKYIAASDAKASVFLKPVVSPNRGEEEHNQSIQSCRVEIGPREGSKYNINDRRDPSKKSIGRITPFTEIVYHLLQLKTLFTNLDFVRLPSVPFESRVGVYLAEGSSRRSGCRLSDLSHGDQPECVRVRQEKRLPYWRQYTSSQLILYRDRASSSVSLDKYTIFSLRPPELLIFSSPEEYFTWFYRVPCKRVVKDDFVVENEDVLDSMISENLHESYFVDLLEYAVFIREKCIDDCIQFLQSLINIDDMPSEQQEIAEQLLQNIFNPLSYQISFLSSQLDRSFLSRYIRDVSVPVIVNSSISPTNQCKFVIHIALVFGRFQTELDLFKGPTMSHIFSRARIVQGISGNEVDDQEILMLLKRYVLTELLYYPSGGTHTFDSYLVAAYNSLRNALLDESTAVDIPGVLLRDISRKVTSDVQKLLSDKKNATIEACVSEISLVNPSHAQFAAATRSEPLEWIPIVGDSSLLSQNSISEQNSAIDFLIEYVNLYSSSTSGFSRFPVIMGSPGVGKTVLLVKIALYCIARGLFTLFTSLIGETSLRYGGTHCHALLPIPVSSIKGPIDVDRMVEKCVLSLDRNPIKIAFLKNVDVLCIEELGLISAELVSVIDRVLRVIRGSNLPCGGVLVLATMDPLQLPPVEGRPFVLSPLFISMFRVIKLQSYIRSAEDSDLQRINELGRMPHLAQKPWLIDEYCTIVKTRCIFESDIRNVPHRVLRIVGKRVAETEAILERENYILREFPSDNIYISYSVDSESTCEGLQWKIAGKETVFGLNKKCLSPDRLVIYEGCIMRITENDSSTNKYCQGQLCVIDSIPSVTQSQLQVLLSPAGNRLIPDDGNFSAAGWELISLSFPTTSRDVYIRKGLLGRRLQYPLKPFVAYTVHRAMGCTLPAICAQLSLTDKKHHLWMRAQIYTLFSRVQSLDNVTLVGNEEEIIAVLRHLLAKPQQFDDYINEILQSFNDIDNSSMYPFSFQRHSNTMNLSNWPFKSPSLPLPDTSNIGGCVYLLSSLRNSDICYIGQTSSITRRVSEHNRCQGSSSTKDPFLIPWICVAIVTGFDAPDARYHRLEVERMWKHARRVTDSVFDVIESGRRVVGSYAERSLVFQQQLEP